MRTAGRLVVVSNRLPITIEGAENRFRFQQSTGGLVTALLPILSGRRGCWVGWPGADYHETLDRLVKDCTSTQDYTFAPVFLSPAEKQSFYQGCSNEILWPLFHGLPSRCNFDSEHWRGYRKTNGKFADAVVHVAQKDDFVWVHDYHLMLIAGGLRARGFNQRLAYFHHIPFPPPDVFEALPWRSELLRGLMDFDAIGFQTGRDRRNFIGCLRRCLADVRVSQDETGFLVRAADRTAAVQEHPISIDYRQFAEAAADSGVVAAAEEIQHRLSNTQLILGVDRLDYTKGILERLIAFRTLLECHPELKDRVTFVQIVVPSREEMQEYKELRLRIETLVSKINGEYGSPGWVPIHYFYRTVPRTELIAFYRAAHVALVTPLRDGMNLIAKEFCAARPDYRGVLVLREFAGAAEELAPGALIVNPNDTEEVAAMLYLALRMGEPEQRARMLLMRSHIRQHDVFHWARAFIPEAALRDVDRSAARDVVSVWDGEAAVRGA